LYRNAQTLIIPRQEFAAQMLTSLRANRAGQNFIRLSPHFYNTDAELDRFLKALPAAH
jgi:selenocysteine lyase/cysteine desulfurase